MDARVCATSVACSVECRLCADGGKLCYDGRGAAKPAPFCIRASSSSKSSKPREVRRMRQSGQRSLILMAVLAVVLVAAAGLLWSDNDRSEERRVGKE